MNKAGIIQRQPTTSLPAAPSLLQRQCDCGNHTPGGGACESCSKKPSRTSTGLAGSSLTVSTDPMASLTAIGASNTAVQAKLESSTPVWPSTNGLQVGTKNQGAIKWDEVNDAGLLPPAGPPAVASAPAGPAPAACVRPNNFTHSNPRNNGPDGIRVDLAWGSTSGNLADLAHCKFREVVDYDPIPNPPFLWDPPNPTIIELPATSGSAIDTHSYPPGLKTGITDPRESGTMTAHQVYQFKCTGPGCSGTWDTIPGQSHTITREVFPEFVRSNPWRYKITKTGVNFSRAVEIPEP